MPSYCFKPIRVPRVRATLLDSCGAVVESSCSSITTSGIVTIEQTAELQDRDEFYEKNADGEFCVEDDVPPILKWYNLTITFCEVDPEMVYFMNRQTLIMSDEETPSAIGNVSRQGDIALVNFGFEAWTRLANQSDCADGVRYGYILWPWVVEGTMGDVTYQNGTANFVVTARTKRYSLWDEGPYAVYGSLAAATLGQPMVLPTPVTALDHRQMFVTTLPPPVAACGCTAIGLTMSAPTEDGLDITLTLPTGTAPAFIDWGDSSVTASAAGPTALHTYAGAGTYEITLYPLDNSSAAYTVSTTVAP
jgi:hypothetical protein